MTEMATIRQALEKQFSNITEIDDTVVRGERLYGDKRFAIAYIDFSDDVVHRAKDLRSFQEKLIGAEYFSSPDQLRWSSYLYFVAGPKSLGSDGFDDAKAYIEANRDYTRKFVLSSDDMLWILKDSPLFLVKRDVETADVTMCWESLLENRHLDILLDKPVRTKALERIVKGKASKQSVSKRTYKLSPKDLPLTEGFLRSLDITTFRPVHDGQKFRFADVNLIYGPNGSGKTSLLEAIEYLYCGHNRRMSSGGAFLLKGSVQSEPTDSEKSVLPTSETARIKGRNFAWYRMESHQSKNIVDGFTRYNFLDTDAAFRISTELDPKSLHDDLRRLLVGAEASTLWDYFKKVKGDIDVKLKELRQEKKIEAELCESLKKQIADLKQAPTLALSMSKTFRAGLQELGWKGTEAKEIGIVKEGERKSLELVAGKLAKIFTLTTLTPFTKTALNRQIEVINTKYTTAVPLEKERSHIIKTIANHRRELISLEQTATLLSEWKSFCVAGSPKLIREVENGRIAVRNMREQLGTLATAFLPKLPEHLARKPLQIAAQECASHVRCTHEKVLAAEADNMKIKSLQEKLFVAQAQLQNAARQLIIHTGRNNICPICETVHDPAELHAKIEALTSESAASYMIELAKLLQDAKEQEAHAIRLKKEVDTLLECCFNIGLDGRQVSADEVSSELTMRQVNLQKAAEALQSAEENIANLDDIGLSLDRYLNLRSKIGGLFEEGDDVEDAGILEVAMKDINSMTVEIDQQILALTRELENLSEMLLALLRDNTLPNSLFEVSSAEKVQASLSEHLERSNKAVEFVHDIEKILVWPESWTLNELEQNIVSVTEAFDKAMHSVKTEQSANASAEQLQINYDVAKESLREKLEKIQRLQVANETLLELIENHSLDAAMDEVLTSIKDQINDVFGRIHTPREYEFAVSEENLLMARGKNAPHSLDQISTGQRAACALSVFLALNSTARSAPPVLLIDDPIAHVDDLNALSFIDYLRDLVLHARRQLFFATADSKVAALFEKKFVFLGPDRFRKISLDQRGTT
jgi:chromosome segregation protein